MNNVLAMVYMKRKLVRPTFQVYTRPSRLANKKRFERECFLYSETSFTIISNLIIKCICTIFISKRDSLCRKLPNPKYNHKYVYKYMSSTLVSVYDGFGWYSITSSL